MCHCHTQRGPHVHRWQIFSTSGTAAGQVSVIALSFDSEFPHSVTQELDPHEARPSRCVVELSSLSVFDLTCFPNIRCTYMARVPQQSSLVMLINSPSFY